MVFLGFHVIGCLLITVVCELFLLSPEDFEDTKNLLNGLIGFEMIGMLITAIPFITWFFVAALNREKQLGHGLPVAPWWAIGGWFIPFANFVYPYYLAEAISKPEPHIKSITPLIGAWWMTLLIPLLIMRVQSKASLPTLQILVFVELGMLAVSAVLAIFMIRYINNQQLKFAGVVQAAPVDEFAL
ncbi:hypothetical protein DC3_26940 [Deinococcus cellulosilyticus NBRC 106333 = KACC 11606]|uniref:DUF4328 domain-containing protein n=2 Tax=Deinococcus cellulosilyticus TaxID=401558 RepID=A0A511N2H0_DEIC1|nr:hypothetical protein DC3_26940 [Deinococcus cellulosilyticus NBRC 106333 = KACC 11606]